jgi:hypothetical protein
MNRSSWASGRGYVPSCSIGFWVASTKNGSGRRCRSPPTVNLGPRDVRGHQVGRELDPVIGQVQRIGQGVNHEGLGQPGHPDQETVPPREDGHEQLLEHRVLAHDDLRQLALESRKSILEPLDGGKVIVLEHLLWCFVVHARTSLGRLRGCPGMGAGSESAPCLSPGRRHLRYLSLFW